MQELSRRAAVDYPGLEKDPDFVRVVQAVGTINRQEFVPNQAKAVAFLSSALTIGYGQTISDPYIVALMTWVVGAQRNANVMEVGTGSGYQAALLSTLGATVHTIEIVPELAASADAVITKLSYANVTVRAGDGYAGWPEFAPYDAIIVTAGSDRVPQPLLDQLKLGGKLIMPIGASTGTEQLVLYSKAQDGKLSTCSLGPVMFVPLTGQGEVVDRPGLYDRKIPLCRKGQVARWPGQPVG